MRVNSNASTVEHIVSMHESLNRDSGMMEGEGGHTRTRAGGRREKKG